MCSINHRNSIDDDETFILLLNRKIPLKHLNFMYCLDNKLNKCISTKYDDISNMTRLTYNVQYDSTTIESILNLLKSNHGSLNIFSLENINDIIHNYSINHHFLTHTSPHTIEPFTLSCLLCQQPLKLVFKEKVNVFLLDRIENGITYSAYCCQIEYNTSSYIKYTKRFVNSKSLSNQKYINFGGKCVITTEVLLRYVSDLISMVS